MSQRSGASHRSLAILPSGIDGYGVFVKKAFKKGAYIAAIKGSKVVYKSYFRGQSNRYSNWIGVGKDTWIDPVDEFQYINHSCDPNAGIAGKRTLKAYALRDIAAGEELTIDYSTVEEDHEFIFENTEPKHPKYRQFVGPIQSLPHEAFKAYLPFIPDYFKKVYEDEVLSKDDGAKH